MKALLGAAVPLLALVFPSSLSAASISFEQPFTFNIHSERPSTGVLTGILEQHSFGAEPFEWDIPAFDPALGIVEGLDIFWPWTADVTITSDPPDSIGAPILLLSDNITGQSGSCCAALAYPPGSPQVHLFLFVHPDSHAYYDIGISATFDILITGTVTATYHYQPAVTAIPEPTTLLLLGGGLIGWEWKRRRRHGHHMKVRCAVAMPNASVMRESQAFLSCS